MSQISPLVLGLLLLVVGIGSFLLIPVLARLLSKREPASTGAPLPPMPLEIARHMEAVLLVQSGGRIVYHNRAARQLLELFGDEPNLDRLGRRARPSEVFWGLCAAEGQARFLLDGRVIEGISYNIPFGSTRAVLVTLRRPQLLAGRGADESAEGISPPFVQGLSTLAEVSEAITASLDLETTLQAVLESVERLILSDLCEINIWDPENRFLIPYRLIGTQESGRRLEKSSERYTPNLGYTGYLAIHRQPLLIQDVETYRQVRPADDREKYPFRSYLGVPLEVGNDLVGTLELASLSKEGFSENDLELLRMLSRQAALALRNALRYEAEEKRSKELFGLSQLAQAAGAQREPQELYTRLVEIIASLLEVEVLGFWIFDEDRHALKGQVPFFGVQQTAIEWSQITLPPGSEADKLWSAQETIVATNATTDERIRLLKLDTLAIAAGIRQTVLAPLASGGRVLGYLQVGDKCNGSPFNQEDLHLIAIVTGQVAPMIENAGLVLLSRRRAQRAETMQRIASLTSSSATLDEILKFSIQDIARLLYADMALVLLLDEGKGELRAHRPSLFGIPPEVTTRLARIPVDDPQFRYTVTGTRQLVLVGDIMEDPTVLPVYRSTVINLQGRSVIVAPLLLRERGIGEIMLISRTPGYFDLADQQAVDVTAGQLAGAIERASLYTQTDESLRRRVDQLTSITRISRELNSTLQFERLLQRVYDEILLTTRADCGSIMLFELRNQDFVIAPSATPRIILSLGDPVAPELHRLERQVLEQGESMIVDSFDQPLEDGDDGHNHLALAQPPHEGVNSAMVVPIAYQEQIAGLIHLHAYAPRAFDETSKDIAETLAIQAAIALGNAQRYQEQLKRSELLNRRVETLAKLFETSQALQLELPLEQALENIAYAIQAATPFNIVVISTYNAESKQLERITNAGLSLADMAELRNHPQEWSALQQVLKPEFQVGRSYFIPFEQMPVMPPDVHSLIIQSPDSVVSSADGRADLIWHPEDALVVPLLTARGEPLGLISVDAPRDNLRPDRPTIETLEIFGSQASLVIESQNKISRLQVQLKTLQQDMRVTQKAAETERTHLPVLLHKDLEQTLAIRRLNWRARRIRAGIDIADIANRQPDRSSVLNALASEILTRMDLDAAIVVEPGVRGPHLLHLVGAVPAGTNVEALIGQSNPLLHCLQTGKLLYSVRLDGTEWNQSPLLQALDARSFICFTILAAGRLDAAILVMSISPLDSFTEEDSQLFDLLARQVGVTLQNLQLLTETSQRLAEVNLLLDFNSRLGGLDLRGVAGALADSTLSLVPLSHAVITVLWDANRRLLVPAAVAGGVDPVPYMEISYRPDEALMGQVFESGRAVILDEVDFVRHYNLPSESLLSYRNATGGRLPVSCMVVPIQSAEGARPLGVLLLENYQSAAAFTDESLALVTSLAQQTALNLENTRLYQAAEERASQLQALTGVAATITSNLRPDDLVATLLDLLEAILPFDTGTLWLRQGKKLLVVRAARGFADDEERVGLTVAVEDSALLSQMLATGLPIAIGDVRQDMRFPSLVEPERLSWLSVPLIASGDVIGVIALEKTETNFYTPEHSQIATTFAGQAAVALENARLYQESLTRTQELDQRSQRLEMLNRLSGALSATLEPRRILEAASQELARAINSTGALGVLFAPDGKAVLEYETPEPPDKLPNTLPEAPLFERLRESLGVFNTDDVSGEADLAPLSEFFSRRSAGSVLAITLATGSEAQGLLLAYAQRKERFSADEVGLARTIGNQTSIAIQNARLYAETRSLTQDLEQRVVERTVELERAHHRAETLLRIISELSTSLDLEQVLNRSLQLINQIVDAGQISVLIARPGEKKLHRLASLGYAGNTALGGKTTPFNVDQGLAGWVISSRQAALIEDVLRDPRWILLTDSPQPQHRSCMAVPLMVGAECLGVLLLYHSEVGHFSTEQLDLVQAAANQVAVAINNAELYRLIRDQAEDLGNMFRRQQVEASRSRSILEAVADGVLVTDATRVITLFNASAEDILELERSQVIGKSLDHFIGLFGGAGQRWSETIRTWSQDPTSYQPGDIYAEQINLEDGRVVSVHLSPVSMRESFLGTVSTFRDITHQVQLDRLKSEFVATVSHELRTPMTSIKGYVDILLMGAAGELSDQQGEFLGIVRNNTERLAVLVNDLLDISRIEAGRVTISMLPLNLEEVCREAARAMQARMEVEQKPMQIEVEAPPGLPRATGDMDRVRQILDNLLENAYYYTEAGGNIRLQIHVAGDELQVDVVDNGIGISPDTQPRIFERFYRGEHPFVLATSGTGLGLAIVQHLVQMHNGKIWFESSGIPGEGSTFSFTLPIYRMAET